MGYFASFGFSTNFWILWFLVFAFYNHKYWPTFDFAEGLKDSFAPSFWTANYIDFDAKTSRHLKW